MVAIGGTFVSELPSCGWRGPGPAGLMMRNRDERDCYCLTTSPGDYPGVTRKGMSPLLRLPSGALTVHVSL
jgi:hypothetical protein